MPLATPPKAKQRQEPALLELARNLHVLDPIVRAFLDTFEKGSRPAAVHETSSVILPGHTDAEGREFTQAKLPVLAYLTITSGDALPRQRALQLLSTEAGIAVCHVVLTPDDDTPTARTKLCEALAAAVADEDRLDTNRLAIGGDGLGATMAMALVLDRTGTPFACRLLILATPILSSPSAVPGTAWMSAVRATELAERRAAINPRLARIDPLALPPILLLTAEADPFRDGGEALTRRLMAAGSEVTALRGLGTIHDFTWIPELTEAPSSIDSRRLMAAVLRRHLIQTFDKDQ